MTDTPAATDTPPEATPDTPEVAPTDDTGQNAEPDPSATDDDRLPDDHPVVKALAKANKEAEAARLRIKEFEDASKSEQEKAADKASEAQQRADAAEAELARHKAAIKHGLTADDLDLLGTGTAEEIEQRAERLATRLAAATPSGPPASRNQGSDGGPAKQDPNKIADEIERRARGY